MSDLPHLRIPSNQTAENYTYAGGAPQNVVFERPPRNKPAHGPQVRAALENAQAQAVQQRDASRQQHPQLVELQPEGVNLTFHGEAGFELNLDSRHYRMVYNATSRILTRWFRRETSLLHS